MKYTALDIAKYIINHCVLDGCAISNLQLQKILYFVFGEYLRQTKLCLFDEKFLAWQYGPVVENVYEEYRWYGASKIYDTYDIKLPLDIARMIDPVIRQKRNEPIGALINESHRSMGAWERVYDGYKSTIIPLKLIQEDFCDS